MIIKFPALAIALGGAFLTVPYAFANPFDPSSYIKKKETEKGEEMGRLQKRSIYRVDGKRFIRYDTPTDGVLFPATKETPDIRDSLAICAHHLGLYTEVYPVRKDLPLDKFAKDQETNILKYIGKCRDGKIKSPIVERETPDGAVIQIEATKPGKPPNPGDKPSEPGAKATMKFGDDKKEKK